MTELTHELIELTMGGLVVLVVVVVGDVVAGCLASRPVQPAPTAAIAMIAAIPAVAARRRIKRPELMVASYSDAVWLIVSALK